MCPIEIESTEPYFRSSDLNTLQNKGNIHTGDCIVDGEEIYVLPEGLPPEWAVKVIGFDGAPGGMIESQRFTAGFKTDDFALTTREDEALNPEIGLNAVVIDGIIYRALKP